MIHVVGFASLISGLVAQLLKVVVTLVQTRKLRLERFFDTGGMPSSHTSLVTTLTIGVARDSGIDSTMFSIVLLFSMYVVFEAAGLRQEVGYAGSRPERIDRRSTRDAPSEHIPPQRTRRTHLG